VLAGALGVAALSACDVDDLRPPEDDPTPTPSATTTTAPEPDADARLVDEVVAAIEVAAASVLGARRLPRLRKRLGPASRMHDAHLEALGADAFTSDQPVVPASPAEGLRTVRAQEQLLQQVLVGAAGRAQSGALARLLASMSASVSQHLAALPAPPAPPATDGSPS
jgi:hypothetical protein